MKKRVDRCLACLFFCASIMACGDSLRISERWEGIQGDRLRVYVRDTLPEDSPRHGDEDREPILMENARQRAYTILNGYIVMRTGNAGEIPVNLRPLVAKALEKGRMILSDEKTEYTAAYIEYDIKIVLDELSSIEEKGKSVKPDDEGGSR